MRESRGFLRGTLIINDLSTMQDRFRREHGILKGKEIQRAQLPYPVILTPENYAAWETAYNNWTAEGNLGVLMTAALLFWLLVNVFVEELE